MDDPTDHPRSSNEGTPPSLSKPDFSSRNPNDPKGWKMYAAVIKEWYKKPWVILLSAAVVIFVVLAVSVNSLMIALFHSRDEVYVPQLEGVGLMDALQQVSENDLALRQDSTEFDDTLPAGTILRQHPPAGMKVRAGRSVRVVISKGGQVVFVPNILGKPLVEAQSMLSTERLQVGSVDKVFSLSVPEGSVVEQNPSSGTVVTHGVLVDIQVSKGLPPSGAPLLPSFEGQTLNMVRQWATDVGAPIEVVEDKQEAGVPGSVVRQEPAAGQPLVEGSPIIVTIVPVYSERQDRFVYNVPEGRGKTQVKMIARDYKGEKEIYNDSHRSGDVIELPLDVKRTTRVRIYLDDDIVEEKVVEPKL